ncbi:glutaredoxin [Candidatus Peregrinibacteria bacterium]|nr:glutaredoxin [Candidatus Peregrinibacteria bacterium]
MPKITIWTKDYCPYCKRAKALLDSLNYKYVEMDITNTPEKIEELKKLSNALTVPQIFVDGKFIGGCTDIEKLHEEGKLQDILNGK